jgi:hypothetical protein
VKETIEKAAIKNQFDIISLPQPNRHNDIISYMIRLGIPAPIKGEQGFLTSNQRFVDRREAATITLESGQIRGLSHPPNLYSEDLW